MTSDLLCWNLDRLACRFQAFYTVVRLYERVITARESITAQRMAAASSRDFREGLGLPEGTLVAMIKRGGGTVIPYGATDIRPEDVLVCIKLAPPERKEEPAGPQEEISK